MGVHCSSAEKVQVPGKGYASFARWTVSSALSAKIAMN